MKYKALKRENFTHGQYSIVPIRLEDRYAIMNWRNQQIHHLRQSEELTNDMQDQYFSNVVAKLFELDKPDQLLFSYLKENKCIGYGGLVHINWVDLNAEISFIMDTELEEKYFEFHWTTFLKLIQTVAFVELKLHKVYVWAFDVRPYLYNVLLKNHFFLDAKLQDHCKYKDDFIDVVIHSKIRKD